MYHRSAFCISLKNIISKNLSFSENYLLTCIPGLLGNVGFPCLSSSSMQCSMLWAILWNKGPRDMLYKFFMDREELRPEIERSLFIFLSFKRTHMTSCSTHTHTHSRIILSNEETTMDGLSLERKKQKLQERDSASSRRERDNNQPEGRLRINKSVSSQGVIYSSRMARRKLS